MALGEFELIARLTRNLPTSDRTVRGVGDDCAVLRGTAGDDLLVTCDMLIEGVHFRRDTMSWPAVGSKAITCGLSDVAAMGGTPQWAVVSLGLPLGFPPADADALYQGLSDQARRFRVDVVGGDTVQSLQAVVIDVTVLGTVSAGLALLRSAARPGDAILVTGRLGDAAAGLDALLHGGAQGEAAQALIRAHQWPAPRCDIGRELPLAGAVHACIDVSDGLAGDLAHICEASDVSAIVWEDAVPLSTALRAYATEHGKDPLTWALGGGEDYELLFTMPEAAARLFVERWNSAGRIPVSLIGAIEPGPPGLKLRRRSGVTEPLVGRGYDHFRLSDT